MQVHACKECEKLFDKKHERIDICSECFWKKIKEQVESNTEDLELEGLKLRFAKEIEKGDEDTPDLDTLLIFDENNNEVGSFTSESFNTKEFLEFMFKIIAIWKRKRRDDETNYRRVNFSTYIKTNMEYKKISNEDLARISGLTLIQVDDLLEDNLKVDPDVAFKLTKVFGLSTDYYLKIYNNCIKEEQNKYKLMNLGDFKGVV